MKEPDAAQFRPESVGLFLDVDGTLIEFAPDSQLSRDSPGAPRRSSLRLKIGLGARLRL